MKFIIVILVLFLFLFRVSYGTQTWYESCNRLVTCGSFVPVGFPFWGGKWRPKECGYPHLRISCADGLTPTLTIEGLEYVLLNINEVDRVIRVARKDYYTEGVCLKTFFNTSLNWNQFQYLPTTQNSTVLYGCLPLLTRVLGQFSCRINGTATMGYYVKGIVNPLDYDCNLGVVVPTEMDPEIGLKRVFQDGFQLNYTLQNHEDDFEFCQTCEGAPSNGSCGYDNSRNKTVCLCPYGVEDSKCKTISTAIPPTQAGENKSNKQSRLGLIIGLSVGGGVAVGGLMVWIVFFLRNRQFSEHSTDASSQSLQQLGPLAPPRPSPNSILEEASTLGIKLFNYTDLEKATDNFDEYRVLGDGACGTVYYGKLSDGQEVAVKRFSQYNVRRMGHFENEVNILARLRHKNLLVLFGCTSRMSKEILLVYEYISNGTLEDHLHGRHSRFTRTTKLPWPIRLKIAVEIAEGLTFLHQNDVVHRDVKTANILLDNNLQAKVADFGLARLFPQDVSHVSTFPQGTPGYLDPQYFRTSRLSEKSDVYSFGVVLMELISGKEAVDNRRRPEDVNLTAMALDRIQKGEMSELVDSFLRYDVDPTIKTSIDLVVEVGVRCLQEDSGMRPSTREVLQRLQEIQMGLREFEASTSSAH